MANLYYCEDLEPEAFTPGSLVEVVGEEARHAVRVSRLRAGERILIGNGFGAVGEGVAEEVGKDRCTVRIERSLPLAVAPATELVLVQALAKGDRDERSVEQSTEFGVDAIVPWQASRSVSRWDGPGGAEKVAKGVAKWRRIAREAAKQSMRARIPEVWEPTTLDALCAIAAQPEASVVALHPRGGRSLTEFARSLARSVDPPQRVHLVVGPEGGFADAELDALQAAGAEVRVLGETVLRTSSAGPAALAVLNTSLGRW